MHGMCGNAVKRGVVTGPPTKEKREMEPFLWDSFAKGERECVCVSPQRGWMQPVEKRNKN